MKPLPKMAASMRLKKVICGQHRQICRCRPQIPLDGPRQLSQNRSRMDTLASLVELRKEIKRDFEKELAAVDYLISRRTQRQIAHAAVAANPTGARERASNGTGARGPGRPGKLIDAIREAIRHVEGKPFSLYEI